MCGIAGFWCQGATLDERRTIARAMGSALLHRGPDAHGEWLDAQGGCTLAHRRLRIVDVSEAGAQPMLSHDGRYVLTYNGEVYNAARLARRLEVSHGVSFRGHSDTEVVLEAISHWGLEATLQELVGMFAFAVFDREQKELALVRDPVGIKPLYYSTAGGMVLFGSELRALRAHPSFHATLNEDAVAMLMCQLAIPAPHTIYAGVSKLLPGQIVRFSSYSDAPRLHRYWDALETRRRCYGHFKGSFRDAVDAVDEALVEAVRDNMVSDVPLGALLSGGVDSSTVVTFMREVGRTPVKTFSLGFSSPAYDETAFAREVASELGCEHRQLIVTAKDALQLLPRLPEIADEPFADASLIPTYLVAQFARAEVNVVLTGDGGDELFGGYNRHRWGPGLWRALQRIPRSGRHLLRRWADTLNSEQLDSIHGRLLPLIPPGLRVPLLGNKLQKLLRTAECDESELYSALTTPHDAPLVLARPRECSRSGEVPPLPSQSERFMLADFVSYLPDDILTKVDRASMAVGLEARVPLLHRNLLELVWSLPAEYKVSRGTGKRVLRHALQRRLSRSVVHRPKMGFGPPLAEWLRGPLRPWVEGTLQGVEFNRHGYFAADRIHELWRRHLLGFDCEHTLWPILMFETWRAHEA